MGFYRLEDGTGYHLNEAKPPRVVPGNKRHKWDNGKINWGQQATCRKCGCVRKLNRKNWSETFQMPGQAETTTRPDCTGTTLTIDYGNPEEPGQHHPKE